MDHFGIGAAVQAAARIYFQSAIQTGRTTSLVESVKTGDRLVFSHANEARRVEGLCRERGVKVQCVVVPVHDPSKLMELGSCAGDGRTIFDHLWLEERYLHVLKHAAATIDTLQRETSGYGAAHRETRRKYQEHARWDTPMGWDRHPEGEA